MLSSGGLKAQHTQRVWQDFGSPCSTLGELLHATLLVNTDWLIPYKGERGIEGREGGLGIGS